MSDELFNCTARQLATTPPETIESGTTVRDAVDWFETTGYDYAPVVEGDEPIGFVGHEMLADCSSTQTVERVATDIRLEHIISSDTPFFEVLTGLEDQFFYLLGGKNRVTGILTRADLNTSPARIHLFDRISFLEINLRKVITESGVDWKEPLHPDAVAKIRDRYERANEANVELDEIHYAGFNALTTIVGTFEACWRACGYEVDHKARSDLNKITDLRNDVAHSNLILQTTSAEYDTDGRSIRDLVKIYEALINCNDALRDRGEDATAIRY